MPFKSSVTTIYFQKNEGPLNRFFENFKQSEQLSEDCSKLIIDAPKNQRFVNFFLNSDINVAVDIAPSDMDWVNYAGFFSGCKNLSHVPKWDNSKNRSMAAMFKSCENMRFSLYGLDTSNTTDFRQCFWGAKNYSGNGPQSWNFSSARSPDAMRNFMGGGCSMRQAYYDQFIESLWNQMQAGTLPTPMQDVDMGDSKYSPYYAGMRQELIDYGWELLDGGQAVPTVEPSKWEKEFFNSVHDRIANDPDNWLDGVDMSCHTRSSHGGILISPRHMIYAYHWMPPVGKKVVFWNGQEGIVEHRDAGLVNYGDLVLVRLKEPVQGANPVLFLEKDWEKQCPQLAVYGPPSPFLPMENIPTIWLDQRDRACVSAVSFITPYPRMPSRVIVVVPEHPVFRSKYKDAIPGDSGSPQCFLYKNRFVFSHPITSGGAGIGTWVNLKEVRDYIDDKLAVYGEKVQILGDI
jgi:hypothetical protein